MQLSSLLTRLLRFLLPACLIATTLLYTYPPLRGCRFPQIPPCAANASTRIDCNGSSTPAPFRLLALGDPQLEGDSSVPAASEARLPHLRTLWSELRAREWRGATAAAKELVMKDLWKAVATYHKRLDLLGNDFYLAHIYRSLRFWTRPTHVTVLGDLLGSQWVSDAEFERRGSRFWGRVFCGAERVPGRVMDSVKEGDGKVWREVLGQDEGWRNRVIAIAGNHDVGYAGDLSEERVERFERVFGRVNWEVVFTLPKSKLLPNTTDPKTDEVTTGNPATPSEAPTDNTKVDGEDAATAHAPELRLLILNSMNLDIPALSAAQQTATYTFINDAITRSRPVTDPSTLTLLLTHIPLHKPAGVCVDAPFFAFYPPHEGTGVREQNHLSQHASASILEGVFGLSGRVEAPARGMGRRGVILTGHDHEGCDVVHFHLREDGAEWSAVRTPADGDVGKVVLGEVPRVREVTLRSMMGEFGGYAGFVSAWFEEGSGEWRVEVQTCGFAVQHWWWAVHVLDLVTLGVVVVVGVLRAWKGVWGTGMVEEKRREEKKESVKGKKKLEERS